MQTTTEVQRERGVSALFDRIRLRVSQAVDEPLLNKCKRWGAASVAIAFAVACVIFGAVYSYSANMVLAMRQGFAFFWLALGVTTFVSTFGIARWLGIREDHP